MKITFTATKPELDLLLRGIQTVLIEENEKSMRRLSGYRATSKYRVAEQLEERLEQAIELIHEARGARACRR